MQRGRASRTAAVAAAARAFHHQFATPVILEDPFALAFADQCWRRMLTSTPLRWFMYRVFLRPLRPVGAQIIARSRYAEDLLERAIAAGIRQYVIVGAGFDSFALRRRDLQSTLQIFELDHPDTQRVKIERIRTLGVELPGNLEFVEVDFERATVAEALIHSSYQAEQQAFFSWLGTTAYLSRSATIDTLGSIAQLAAPGSEIVFDYLVPENVLSISDRQVVERLRRFTARRGEPLIGEFHPAELEKVLAGIGFELIENFSGAAQEKRYFGNRNDGLRPLAASFFAHARVLGNAA